MARETGLEPATSGVTGRRSNQLSYSPAKRARLAVRTARYSARPAKSSEPDQKWLEPRRQRATSLRERRWIESGGMCSALLMRSRLTPIDFE